MNCTNFKKWLEQELVNGVPLNSVLVMHNAPDQTKQMENYPIYNTRKDDTGLQKRI